MTDKTGSKTEGKGSAQSKTPNNWRDQYQLGTFRGAKFRTIAHQGESGRRTVVHPLPGVDEPVVEDLGRAPRRYSLDLFLFGDDYYDRRDVLMTALEAAGPGTLVHPWLGGLRVSVEHFTWEESTEEGGICRFSVDFVEAGPPEPVTQAADGKAKSVGVADAIAKKTPELFSGRFSIDGWPDFVQDAAGTLVEGLALWTQAKAAIGGGVGPTLRVFEKGLTLLGAGSLLRSPLALGNALVGLVQTVSLLGGTPRRRVAAFSSMIAYDPQRSPIVRGNSARRPTIVSVADAPTPARRQEAANRDALLHAYRVTAAAELVRTVATMGFSSQDEAEAVKAAIVDQLDALAADAADAGEDDRAADYDDLRRTIARDVGQRTPTLPSLRSIETRLAEPAIVIANRLYGHALADERGDDIVARNGIANPAFVPAGDTIKVIANG